MHTSVLWEPEEGRCTQCGTRHLHARLYTDGSASTRFCRDCWTAFIVEECNVTHEPLRTGVAVAWGEAVTFRLEFEGDAESDGASPEPASWN